MNTARLKVFVQRDRMWGDSIHVRMGRAVANGFAVALPLQWRVEPADAVEAREDLPCFSLKNDEAQALMDELWQVGFRPTEGAGSAGAMAATQAHLRDLQRLVFEEKAR